jgi:ATP-dependent DNA helicase RecQ
LEAECCLLYSGGDFMTWKRIIEDSESAGRKGAMEALSAIYNFCTGVECRHQALVTHFGQTWQKESCDACDVCLGTLDVVADALIVGQKILSCVLRVEQRFGAEYVAQVLSGSKDKRILANAHDRLSTWGILAEEGHRASRDWIEQLTSQQFLAKDGEYNVLKVTAAGQRLLRGEVTPRLLRPAKRPKKERSSPFGDSWEGVDRDLFDQLRELRSEHAARQQVPAYIIFSDAVLRDMARLRPSTPSGFRQVRGVGEKKCDDFGDAFLGCITSYCQQHGVSMDQAIPAHRAEPLRPEKSGPTMSATIAFPYFDQGKSVAEVAQALNRALSTTTGYLTEYLQHKRITDPSPWIDPATVERIIQAANEAGIERLRPIFDALGGEVDYERIRIVVECLRNRAIAFDA